MTKLLDFIAEVCLTIVFAAACVAAGVLLVELVKYIAAMV